MDKAHFFLMIAADLGVGRRRDPGVGAAVARRAAGGAQRIVETRDRSYLLLKLLSSRAGA